MHSSMLQCSLLTHALSVIVMKHYSTREDVQWQVMGYLKGWIIQS